jgi:hypothetical protein
MRGVGSNKMHALGFPMTTHRYRHYCSKPRDHVSHSKLRKAPMLARAGAAEHHRSHMYLPGGQTRRTRGGYSHPGGWRREHRQSPPRPRIACTPGMAWSFSALPAFLNYFIGQTRQMLIPNWALDRPIIAIALYMAFILPCVRQHISMYVSSRIGSDVATCDWGVRFISNIPSDGPLLAKHAPLYCLLHLSARSA